MPSFQHFFLFVVLYTLTLSYFVVFAMPELPEVEAARKFVEELCVGSKIVKMETKEQGGGPRDGLFDDIVIETDNKLSPDTSGGGNQSKEPADLTLQRVMLNNTLI
ncbi:hypothetical protein EON63_20195, partial [archaeon]